jgi:predicted nucleic acid-binding protein
MARSVVLDTSVILNVIAAGPSLAILESLACDCFISTAAASEAIYIRADDPAQPPQVVSVEPWVQSGKVTVVSPQGTDEEELYVRFAAELDDGEAMSLAICCARRYALATDDRKARRLAKSLMPVAVDLLSTAEMVHRWATSRSVHGEALRKVILAVENRARFRPPQDDPLRPWWMLQQQG